VSAATQIAYTEFDHTFFALPGPIQERIQGKLDDMGLRLAAYPHYRMKGQEERYRLRVGDYRIIYRLDLARNVMHLLAVGHRREIYK
jgi:mRNA interferase RelE/StbE